MPASSIAPKTTGVTLELLGLEHWRGEKQLFSDLSFKLSAPVLHLSGDNGSGKTSLLKVLCHLSQPEQGDVIWRDGATRLSKTETMAMISYTGHRDGLNPMLSVYENLTWAVALNRAVPPGESLDQLLEAHDLSHLRDQSAASLSAGQRKRVALLRGAASGCPVWVWDEPYANLDSAGRDWVDQMILRHTASNGVVIASSHQQPVLATHLMQTLELGA